MGGATGSAGEPRRLEVGALVRGALWAVLLGGLSAFLASLVAVHAVGPVVVAVARKPDPALWNPLIAGLSLAIAGPLVVLAVGRIVALPPRLAAAGVAAGAVWMALLTVLAAGFAALWASVAGLLLRCVTAAIGAAAGHWVVAATGRKAAAAPAPPVPPLALGAASAAAAEPAEAAANEHRQG